MSFKDYAFTQFAERLTKLPDASFEVMMGFSRTDYFMHLFQTKARLKKRPGVYSREGGQKSYRDNAGLICRSISNKINPFVALFSETEEVIGVSAQAATVLPAVFATFGYAFEQGRRIEITAEESELKGRYEVAFSLSADLFS